MTSLSAKARKVIWFLDIIVIEKESAKKAYLQWKNDNKNVNKGSQKYCVFINDNNISNTLIAQITFNFVHNISLAYS